MSLIKVKKLPGKYEFHSKIKSANILKCKFINLRWFTFAHKYLHKYFHLTWLFLQDKRHGDLQHKGPLIVLLFNHLHSSPPYGISDCKIKNHDSPRSSLLVKNTQELGVSSEIPFGQGAQVRGLQSAPTQKAPQYLPFIRRASYVQFFLFVCLLMASVTRVPEFLRFSKDNFCQKNSSWNERFSVNFVMTGFPEK